jgi:protein lifeguard
VGAMPPQAPAGGFGGAGFDVEAQQAANFAAGFAEQQIRSRFVGKVLSIVFLQLLCTVGMSVLFYYVSPLKLYVRQNAWPFYLSWALSFGMLIAMACSETLRRKYPTNVLFLAAFTAVFSFQIAAVTSYFDTQAVMIAFIATTAVVLGCAFIAFFTMLDMTKYGGWLAIAGLSFMVVAMIAAFWPWGGK